MHNFQCQILITIRILPPKISDFSKFIINCLDFGLCMKFIVHDCIIFFSLSCSVFIVASLETCVSYIVVTFRNFSLQSSSACLYHAQRVHCLEANTLHRILLLDTSAPLVLQSHIVTVQLQLQAVREQLLKRRHFGLAPLRELNVLFSMF